MADTLRLAQVCHLSAHSPLCFLFSRYTYNFSMRPNHMESLLKNPTGSVGLGWGLQSCISNKFPGAADAGQVITPWTLLI